MTVPLLFFCSRLNGSSPRLEEGWAEDVDVIGFADGMSFHFSNGSRAIFGTCCLPWIAWKFGDRLRVW
jgi:hypothetical protein